MSTASVAGVRVVGVIDLEAGVAVHAVRGERERYRPIGDPLSIARGLRDGLGLEELYVADLDAIAGDGDNDEVIRALAREARVMVDAGVSEPERARALLELGVHRVIVGTETLTDAGALDRLLPDAMLSLDLRHGRTLSPDPQLAGLPALAAVERLRRPRLRELIVLDLARVGSGAGPDVGPIARIHAAFPDLELLAGGGIRDAGDLRALRDAGAAGALASTALHAGVIGRRELAALR
jgi:phosphoribosylformimino-5-aminoimidazole carboxamide ribotide isomerase